MLYLVYDPSLPECGIVECVIQSDHPEAKKLISTHLQEYLEIAGKHRQSYIQHESNFISKAGKGSHQRILDKMDFMKRWEAKNPLISLRDYLQGKGLILVEYEGI